MHVLYLLNMNRLLLHLFATVGIIFQIQSIERVYNHFNKKVIPHWSTRQEM